MRPRLAVLIALIPGLVWARNDSPSKYPTYETGVARQHEKPHRLFIPIDGVETGWNSLSFTLIVSPSGDVLDANPDDDALTLTVSNFWPQVESEIRQWEFTPFEEGGKAITARVKEFVILIPAEQHPKNHANAPVVGSSSKVVITLKRSGGFWGGPTYTVTVGTDGIAFDGVSYVVAAGKHSDTVDASEVRQLAQRFIDADFYSMNDKYIANITDLPSSQLSISIDGQMKQVDEYGGSAAGMPSVVSDLEDRVDKFARTQRWVGGADGLISSLRQEKFNAQSLEAQTMLKEAASRGNADAVRQFLNAGVPLDPLPAPTPSQSDIEVSVDQRHLRAEQAGWLSVASNRPEVLQIFLDVGASKYDQDDKDRALADAAYAGNLKSVQMLTEYGASINASVSSHGDKRTVLIFAMESGNPEVVREILRYHPQLEARDSRGRTAMFGTDDHSRYLLGNHAECVRLLAAAGADVNARDDEGNTPLHVTWRADVDEELLKRGADVNARNNYGETPIFTTYLRAAIPILLAHGADLTIRNNKGQTALEAAGVSSALREALEKSNSR
jgi:ankyrin repeat protein